MPMPSYQEQRHHAITQAAIRYRGLKLNELEYQNLCNAIAYGDARYVLSQNPGREVWEVQHGGKKLTAVFDTRRKNIVTFLPNGNIVPGQMTGRDRR
jgi:hypothetical protein